MNKLEKKEYDKIYYLKNKEKILKRKTDFYLNNTEKHQQRKNYLIDYCLSNKEKKIKYDKIYRKKNKEKLLINSKKYQKEKRETNPLFKLKGNISRLIKASIRNNGFQKNSRTYKILGCSYEEFKQHLERQFKKGMTWDNQGKWHLDHIYPISLAKDEHELIKLNHYTNFQPMWAIENIIKGNKIIPNTQIKLI